VELETGRSAATSARKLCAAALPEVGPPSKVLAAAVAEPVPPLATGSTLITCVVRSTCVTAAMATTQSTRTSRVSAAVFLGIIFCFFVLPKAES
jgi:hypothetical protein